MTQECNDYVAELVVDNPARFSGFATLPMQDIKAAIAELERSMGLGLKGAMIGDNVNGKTYDEKEFLPFWKAAQDLGAVILVHQGGETVVNHRIDRYHLPNTIGNPADRALTFASLVFGGVMDACPDLKVCLCHGGGYTCFGRIDEVGNAGGLLPIGLTENVLLTRPVQKDAPVPLDAVELDDNSLLMQLRREQM